MMRKYILILLSIVCTSVYAFEYTQKLEKALSGDRASIISLGNYHYYNDDEEALRWMETLSGDGMGDSIYQYGFMLEEFGYTDKALMQYKKAAAMGNGDAYFMLGELAARNGDIKLTNYNFLKSAENGHKHAAYIIGINFYKNGLEEERGIHWLIKSAGYGNSKAMIQLYNHYIGNDKPKAINYIEQAVNTGNTIANYIYAKNILADGVKSDYPLVIGLLTKGADEGHAMSEFELGKLLFKIQSINSQRYLMEADSGGHPYASYYLGRIYEEGRGVNIDKNQALIYYKKAGESGHIEAITKVMDYYQQGLNGGGMNNSVALEWGLRAAKLGDPWSQFNIGVMLLGDEGVDKDLKRAMKWLKKAEKQGVGDATKVLKSLKELE
jgi:TPR repeat protein